VTRILVTGGSGFIGQHLVTALADAGREVRILDIRPPERIPADAQYVQASVLDRKAVRDALVGVDQVYHLAGLPGMWLPRKNEFHEVNYVGTEIVISAARERGVARFLHCSTESILFRNSPTKQYFTGDPLGTADDMPGPYTRSKMLADQLAMQTAVSGFPLVIACPTMPIGPFDRNLTPPTAMLRHFLGNRFMVYLDFIVNLVDVRDVATGLILAMERGQSGHRYILGGESIRLKAVLRMMATITGRRSLYVPIPGRFAEATAALLELIADHLTQRPPAGTAEGVRIALRARALSIEKAQKELGYSPRSVEPALRETVAYLLNGGCNR
jgi:dihydroflavonol-4-reductase